MSRDNLQKVFGVGYSKTGTTTLHRCLECLGFRHKTYSPTMIRHYVNKEFDEIYKVVDKFDSFEDWPWLLMFKEFDKRYPDSKFILTIRKDAETWYQSLKKHLRRNPEVIPGFKEARSIYDNPNPIKRKIETIVRYENHNQEVISYFKGRNDKLLVVCWENGDGWKEICEFMGMSIPNIPFPHANISPKFTMKRYILSFIPYTLKLKVKRILRIQD